MPVAQTPAATSPAATDAQRPSQATERRDWLRLIRSENVGPTTFWALLDRFGSATEALIALPDLARRGGHRGRTRIMSAAEAEAELDALSRFGAQLLTARDPAYPAGLSTLDTPPPLLTVKGRLERLEQPLIALVGSRNASALGRQLAERLAADLGAQGFAVVSGLARGIDAAAHRGALSSGTVAVLAGGIDHVYPPDHQPLYDAIAEDGLVISEMPFGFTLLKRHHFPQRNRIVSGLSRGVLVIEAALRSGSLITARCALEQGREVFAVPGSPLDPRSRGTNNLLRQGAVLTETADDVIEALSGVLARPLVQAAAQAPVAPVPVQPNGDSELDAARRRLRSLLGATPTPLDELIRAADCSTPLVMTALLEWELAGVVHRDPAAGVVLTAAGLAASAAP